MFAFHRFSSTLNLQRVIFSKPNFIPTLARCINIEASNYKTPPKETHDEYNMRIGRPQSPHLTIYAMELPSFLSIHHRMTGVALAGYTFLFGAGTLLLPEPFTHYVDMVQALNLGSIPIYMTRFILAYPMCYHMCNGLRHLIWDLGFNLSMKAVYATGYLMLLTAFSLTTALVLIEALDFL